MAKFLRVASIILIIGVFPALAWYYLKQGNDYYIATHERIAIKEPWNQQEYNTLKSAVELDGKTTVVFNKNVSSAFVDKFYDQYKAAYTFQLVANKSLSFDSIKNDGVNRVTIKPLIAPDVILIDTAAHIRNIYMADQKNLTQLIEDTAILLPTSPRRDISQKN